MPTILRRSPRCAPRPGGRQAGGRLEWPLPPGRLDALLHNLSQRLVQAPALPAIPAEAETTASSTHLHGATTAATSSSSARSPYSELFAWTTGAGRLVRGAGSATSFTSTPERPSSRMRRTSLSAVTAACW